MAVSTLLKNLLDTCTKATHKPSLSKSLGLAAMVTVVSLSSIPGAYAAAIRQGLFDTNTLARNDDLSTGLVDLGFTANFFGLEFDQAYVNNNGNITFDRALPTFTPFDLTSTGAQIIAPFFADVDTRSLGSNEVTYGMGIVDGRNAFGVNYIDVGYFPSAADKLNSFQLVLIERSDTGEGNFDIEFNYDRIEWETGSASGGTGGLGGSSARVGFSNGTGNPGTFFELPGSAVNGAFLDGGPNSLIAGGRLGSPVENNSNILESFTTSANNDDDFNILSSTVNGRYVYEAREGTIMVDVDPPNSIPEPTTILGLLALGAFGATSTLKRKQEHKLVAKL